MGRMIVERAGSFERKKEDAENSNQKK